MHMENKGFELNEQKLEAISGGRLPEEQLPEKTCSHCGTKVLIPNEIVAKAGEYFCPKCGEPVDLKLHPVELCPQDWAHYLGSEKR